MEIESHICLDSLADLYRAQGRYAEAELLSKEVQQAGGEGQLLSQIAEQLKNISEQLSEKTLEQARNSLGVRDPRTLTLVNKLAILYQQQGRYAEAEPLFKEALQARREVLGPRHPDTLQSLNNLAAFYRAQSRDSEAEPLLKEARSIQAR
jgi:tetratricopeptide (TPR) repeat protein